jgi:hypothetical protein
MARGDYRRHLAPRCARCGFSPDHRRQLQIHHRDRDRTNHAASNLETLCANCHALEHVTEPRSTNAEQDALIVRLRDLRRRREEFTALSRAFHRDVAAEFAVLVRHGRSSGLSLRRMCREAGLSHEGGYLLLRRGA